MRVTETSKRGGVVVWWCLSGMCVLLSELWRDPVALPPPPSPLPRVGVESNVTSSAITSSPLLTVRGSNDSSDGATPEQVEQISSREAASRRLVSSRELARLTTNNLLETDRRPSRLRLTRFFSGSLLLRLTGPDNAPPSLLLALFSAEDVNMDVDSSPGQPLARVTDSSLLNRGRCYVFYQPAPVEAYRPSTRSPASWHSPILVDNTNGWLPGWPATPRLHLIMKDRDCCGGVGKEFNRLLGS